MGKPLGSGLPDQLRSSAPKLLGSGAISLRKLSNSILNSGPEGGPEVVEIRRIETALQGAASPAKAGVMKSFKSILIVGMILLSIVVLGLSSLLPSSFLPLGDIITWRGLAWPWCIPGRPQKILTSLLQMCLQGSRFARNPSSGRQCMKI